MNKTLHLLVLFTLLLGTTVGAKAAYVIQSGDITFNTATNTITAYNNSTEKDIIIPSSITIGGITYDVKQIGENAFADKNLTAVVIPNSVDTILDGAFKNNLISSLVIPNSVVKLGQEAFYNNKLTNLTISENLPIIEFSTFRFNLLTTLEIPNGVKEIGSYAFYSNKLTSVTLSQSVEQIGYAAFYYNYNLPSITLPNPPGLIDYRWFSNYSTDEFEGGAEITNYLDSYTAKWYNPYVLTLNDIEFNATSGTISSFSNTEQDDIIIPTSFNVDGQDVEVKKIGPNAFYNKGLATIVFPNTLIEIKSYSFAGNYLQAVEIPESVTNIENSAFRNNNLDEVKIPEGITAINDYTFYQNNLEKIELPTSLIKIGERAFYDNKISKLELPENLEHIDVYAFSENEIDTLTIPTSVTFLGEGVFNINKIKEVNEKNSNGLIFKRNTDGTIDSTVVISYGGNDTKVDFMPEQVMKIGSYAFYNCPIDTLIIPNNVISVGERSFYGSQIKSLTLSESIEEIGHHAFNDNRLTALNFPESIRKIGDFAFYRNDIEKMSLPEDKLTYLGNAAFTRNQIDTLNNKNFNGIFYARTADGKECRDTLVSFGRIQVDADIDTILDGIKHMGEYAFSYCKFKSITLPNSLLSLGRRCLYLATPENGDMLFPTHPELASLGWESNTGDSFNCGETISSSADRSYKIPDEYGTISYELDGGENSTNNPAYFIHSNGITSFYEATKDDHTFKGWYDAQQNKIENIAAGTDTNVVLYAKWISPLTGNVNITGSLKYGEVLSANVTEDNNTGTLSYQWKRDGSDISGANATTHTLTEADIATTISVVVTSSVETGSIVGVAETTIGKANQDAPAKPIIASNTLNSITLNVVEGCEYAINEGAWQASAEFTGLTPYTTYSFTQRYAETSTHNASDASPANNFTITGVILTGTVTITGLTIYGEELTASISEDNNTGSLSYQWKRDGSDISGANATTYTLTEADIATTISVVVTSSVETGSIVGVAETTIGKANQGTPAKPIIASNTLNSITLNVVEGCEYAINEGAWQASVEFTGLTPHTTYSFTQRYAETSTHNASDASPANNFTITGETLTGTVTITGLTVFGEELMASISGDNNTGTLSYQWKRDGSAIVGANTETYTLVKADIATNISVEISSSVETGILTSVETETIEKAEQDAPAKPTVADKSANSITLNEVSGCEYAIDGGEWQVSAKFTDLTANTQYSFTQRYSETDTHKASANSEALIVTTQMSTSLSQNTIKETIEVFPNPTTNFLNIGNLKHGSKIIMFNSSGSMVKQLIVDGIETTLNVSDLNKGIYLVKINDYTTKVIIE